LRFLYPDFLQPIRLRFVGKNIVFGENLEELVAFHRWSHHL
jgi:hypothetical protein